MSVTSTTCSPTRLHDDPDPPRSVVIDGDLDPLAVACILEQKPISVTLDGTAIWALAVTLVLLIHFLDAPLAELLVLLVPFCLLVQNDYNNFIGLGPGGTPPTFQGYVRIAWLRLWALRDPFTPPAVPKSVPSAAASAVPASDPDGHAIAPPTYLPAHGLLPATGPLPYRPGPRPVVAGIAPQRQLDQHGTKQHYRALRRTLESLARAHPGRFGTARSCLEKHGLGLFARHPVNVTCNGEICHVHDSDHSLHLCLHPEDIAEVLRKGWGQRHPLARRGWFGAMPVPEEFLMVYAPRDDQELEIVCRVIEAAIWYAAAERQRIEVVEA